MARRNVGPSGPISGLGLEIEQADKDRATPEQIPQLLTTLRQKRHGAREAFINAFRWIVYEWVSRGTDDFDGDRLSTYFAGLCTAVDRLAKNNRTDVEKFIRDELARSADDFYREESPDIFPPYSTICNQEHRGETPYLALHRIDGGQSQTSDNGDDEDVEYNLLEDSTISQPFTNQLGKPADLVDSSLKRDISVSMDVNDLRLDLTSSNNQQERDVFDLLILGYPVVQIAVTTGITRYRVEQIIESFTHRAKIAGYGDFEARLKLCA